MVLTYVVPDVHAPFESKTKVASMFNRMQKDKPDRVILLGDVLEMHALSTHRKDPRWEYRLEEELEGGRRFLRDLRKAAPKADITYIEANHELRWRTYVQNRAPAMQIVGGTLPDHLGLGELGIQWWSDDRRKGVRVATGQGQVAYCYHGHEAKRSSKHPGVVAWSLAEKLGQNVIIGHVHKTALMAGVVAGKSRFAVEAGCLINTSHRVFDYAGVAPQWTHSYLICDSEQQESPYPKIVRP